MIIIIKKLFKLVIIPLFILIVLSLSTTCFSEDISPPHTFKSGDIISADMLNENFEDIAANQKFLSPSDFLGTWDCNAVSIKVPYSFELTECGWAIDSEDFSYNKNFIITFIDNGNGIYTYIANNQIFGDCEYSPDIENTLPYKIVGDSMYVKKVIDMGGVITSWWPMAIKITNKSKTSFIAYINHTNTYWYCTKKNLPPKKPTNLSADASGFIVTLSWTDNSDDETGFNILRKDSLTGTYEYIANTSATSYPDTVSSTGIYWYRVQAINDIGDSFASNVVKVTVTE